MQSIREVKNRIRAVRNVGQITKAMEVVAATKMRKTQRVLFSSRPYALRALDLLARLTADTTVTSPFLKSPTKRMLFIIVASDKGLTGAFNAMVLREAARVLARERAAEKDIQVLAIGAKAAQYAVKEGYQLVRTETNISDIASPQAVQHIADEVIAGFLQGRWGDVRVISTHFVTTLSQTVRTRAVLPVSIEAVRGTTHETLPEHGRFANTSDEGERTGVSDVEYIYEPSRAALIDALYEHLVRTELYHLIIEANASEHSARRVAMKTASDNASDLGSTLTLEMNKARQASITSEIIEMSSTQAAMTSA